jgi:predicted homoserine dehydrogenase-like protein
MSLSTIAQFIPLSVPIASARGVVFTVAHTGSPSLGHKQIQLDESQLVHYFLYTHTHTLSLSLSLARSRLRSKNHVEPQPHTWYCLGESPPHAGFGVTTKSDC